MEALIGKGRARLGDARLELLAVERPAFPRIARVVTNDIGVGAIIVAGLDPAFRPDLVEKSRQAPLAIPERHAAWPRRRYSAIGSCVSTGWSCWLNTVIRLLTDPMCGWLRDGVTASTSVSQRSTSPG